LEGRTGQVTHRPLKALNDAEKHQLVKDVWEVFRKYFESEMNADLRKGIDPPGTGRIDFEIVTNGLEYCIDLLAKTFEADPKDLFARAEPMEETTWATRSLEEFGWPMQEYLVDFSISHGAIDVAIGKSQRHKLPSDRRFELILTAESEIGTENQVCWDLLKLLDTNCHLKILLYEARVSKGLKTIKKRLEDVLNRHARDRCLMRG
jgi:hypothetical protein